MSTEHATESELNRSVFSRVADVLACDNSTVYSFIPIACLVIGSTALNWWLRRASFLSAESFEQPFIAFAMLERLPELGWRNILPLLIVGLMLVRFRSLWMRWSDLPQGRSLRLLVSAAAFVLSWMFATSDYNYYFDESFSMDRLLLVILFLATVYRPVFVIPFLLVLFPFMAQFRFPIGGYTLSVPSLPLHILILFAAMFLTGLLFEKWNASSFSFVVLCVFAGHYWPSGLGKVRLDWLIHDHVYFLLPSTYANGWLRFVSPETISSVTHGLSYFNFPMKVVALIVECGAIVFLWRRSTVLAFLLAWIMLHVGVFLLSGICFWPWVVINSVMLGLVWRVPALLDSAKWSRCHFVASIVLIAGCRVWLWSPDLSWLDAAATYTYRFEAVGETGNVYSLPPRFFAPYHYQFTLSSFPFLSPDRCLNIGWGATWDRELSDRLANAESVDEVLQIEAEFGVVAYDLDAAERLEHFVRRFLQQRIHRKFDESLSGYLKAPSELWTFSPPDVYEGQEDIVRVKVSRLFSGYVDGQYEELSVTPVLEFDVVAK